MKPLIRLLPIPLLLAAPAQAQSGVPCYPEDVALEAIQQKYGERLTWAGIAATGARFAVFTKEKSEKGERSWTLVIFTDEGLVCPLADGHEWRLKARKTDGAPR